MKKYYNAFLIFCFYFIFPFLITAQQPQQYFEKHDVKAGLPQSSVRSIVEDQHGYIWMGTQNGLVRYDGYQYKVYNLGLKKTNYHPITTVYSIYIDRNHTLWISTRGNGLYKYDRESDIFKQFVYPEKDRVVAYSILTDDKQGNLWGIVNVGVEKKYLWKLDQNGHFECFGNKLEKSNYIDASRIYSAFTSSSGKVWFGTNNGFYSYDGKNIPLKGYKTSTNLKESGKVVYLYEPPSTPDIFWMVTFYENFKDGKIIRFDAKLNTYKEFNPKAEYFSNPSNDNFTISTYSGIFFNGIYEDKNQQLWFVGYDGLVRFNRKTETFDYYKTGFEYNKINESKWLFGITETKEGSFWLSSLEGLLHFDTKTYQFKRYVPDIDRPGAILSNQNIFSKIIDHTGALWVGFGWAGANKSSRIKSAFSIYKNNPLQWDSYPKGGGNFALGKNGHNWFSNKDGIYKWKQDTNSALKVFSADSGDSFIGRGCLTREGNFYISTLNNLVFYNTKTGKKEKYATDRIIQEAYIRNPFEDGNGIIWICTRRPGKGVFSFNPKTKKFKAYPYREFGEKITRQNIGALDHSTVNLAYVDREHNLWMGTDGGGLNLYDSKEDQFISYPNSKNSGLSCITDIYEDKTGRLWVGTYLNGLFEFDRRKGRWIRHLDEESGLLFNSVYGINEDALGKIWVTSERGLSRIDPKDLSIKNFPISTILTGNEIQAAYQNLYKLDNGRIASMLSNGVVTFDPKDLDANPFPPKVHLEEIVYSNPDSNKKDETKRGAFGLEKLKLAYNQNRIRFNYIGLHYDNPIENTYAYKLEGYDKDWVQAGTQRTVTYTNLSPGTYTFNLKAANSDGVWSKAKSAITIVISPPWWQTGWSYLLYGVFFIGSMRTYTLFRARNLRRENRVLEEKVNHRTNQLTKSIEDLKTTQTQLIQSEKMASLGELTAGIAHEIQNPLNFVNNFSEVNAELLDEMNVELDNGNLVEVKLIAKDILENEQKINFHGKRADEIVKGMLQHSRSSSGIKEPTAINKLADEYLRLAYHGLRAKDKSFNADLETHFDPDLPLVKVIPQDMGRVLLNLFTNAFYATQQKQKSANANYKPKVSVTTTFKDNGITISVKDNGSGIPEAIKDKILQPFFTTKPSGEGTGLGLSLSYDIIVKGHGGVIQIETQEAEGSEFIIQLPAK